MDDLICKHTAAWHLANGSDILDAATTVVSDPTMASMEAGVES